MGIIDIFRQYFLDYPLTNCSCCDVCYTRPYFARYKNDGEKFCGIINEDVRQPLVTLDADEKKELFSVVDKYSF